MKKCKLGHECADNAKACPQCGYRFTGLITKIVVLWFAVTGVAMLIGLSIPRDEKVRTTGAATSAPDSFIPPSRDEQLASLAKSPKNAKAAKLCQQHLDWSIEDCKTIAERKIREGMTSEQVRTAWGKPDHINTTDVGDYHDEQWVYGSSSYVYIKNGKMYSLQQTK